MFVFFISFSAAKPGRVVGSVVPFVNGRSMKQTYDPRLPHRNTALAPQTVSPHCFFRANTMNQEKSRSNGDMDPSQPKPNPQQFDMLVKPVPIMPVDVNSHPYYQLQAKADQNNDRILIDAKLIQAQSQFGAAGAAVAVAAHRNIGTVQYGLS